MEYDFRITIRGEVARLVDWGPWLTRCGPMGTLLHARGRAGVAIADLTIVREEDVAAEIVADVLTGDGPDARRALCDWAASVGYRRIWLPGEVVDLPPFTCGEASARCTGCRVVLTDGGADFWLGVRHLGRFPSICPLCGSDLPQWSVRQTTGPPADPTVMPIERSTPCS